MTIGVGLRGSTRSAKRLADAVTAQNDMSVAGVSDWSNLDDLALARGYRVVESAGQLAAVCDVLADMQATSTRIAGASDGSTFVQQDDPVAFTPLTVAAKPNRGKAFVVPGADAIALARIVRATRDLCHVNRLYTTIISRSAHAADANASSLDALEPVVGETELDTQLELIFAGVISNCRARRIVAPYTHSHVHMIQLDLANTVEPDAFVAALQADTRILVGAARDGFRSTADINEFFRDLGRSPGDRWESFVWEASIMVVNQSIYLMQDISPEAVAIPEAIDAIRLIGRPQLDLASIRQLTDQSLGLLPSIRLTHQA